MPQGDAARMTSHQSSLTVRREGVAQRCDICHQSDRFDAATGICQRCLPAMELAPKGGYGLDALRGLNVPERLRDTLLREIGDERVLWVGTPHGMLPRQKTGIWLFVGCFMVVVMWGVIGSLIGLISQLLVMIFIILASSFSESSPLRWAFFPYRVLYCITENRVLIIEAGRTLKVTTYGERNAPSLERVEKDNGSGDLIFDRSSSTFEKQGFYGIERVAEVERIIRENILRNAKT
jgi:hypothetical protein